MVSNVKDYVVKCQTCLYTKGMRYRLRGGLRLLPAIEPLLFEALDLFGLLPKFHSSHDHVFVITSHFTKLTRTIPLKFNPSQSVTDIFLTS